MVNLCRTNSVFGFFNRNNKTISYSESEPFGFENDANNDSIVVNSVHPLDQELCKSTSIDCFKKTTCKIVSDSKLTDIATDNETDNNQANGQLQPKGLESIFSKRNNWYQINHGNILLTVKSINSDLQNLGSNDSDDSVAICKISIDLPHFQLIFERSEDKISGNMLIKCTLGACRSGDDIESSAIVMDLQQDECEFTGVEQFINQLYVNNHHLVGLDCKKTLYSIVAKKTLCNIECFVNTENCNLERGSDLMHVLVCSFTDSLREANNEIIQAKTSGHFGCSFPCLKWLSLIDIKNPNFSCNIHMHVNQQ
jgi:hypothetical protein